MPDRIADSAATPRRRALLRAVPGGRSEGESNGWKLSDTSDSPELKVLRGLDGNIYANLSVQLR